jgi:hypothetical protein
MAAVEIRIAILIWCITIIEYNLKAWPDLPGRQRFLSTGR